MKQREFFTDGESITDNQRLANEISKTLKTEFFKVREVLPTDDTLEVENKLLREALEKAPHAEYCEYWNECTCFKKVLK